MGLFSMYPFYSHSQTLTEQDITAVMESSSVKGAFIKCIEGKQAPKSIDMTFIVDEKGHLNLTTCNPTVDNDVFKCFQQVLQGVVFKSQGENKFEVVYPMEFAQASVSTPAVVSTAPQYQVSSTQTPGTVYIVPVQTPVYDYKTAKQAEKAAKRAELDAAKETPTYQRGKSMFIAGVVLTPVGGATVFVSGIVYLTLALIGMGCEWDVLVDPDQVEYDKCKRDFKRRQNIALGFTFGGLLVMGGGIALIVIGAKLKKKAIKEIHDNRAIPQVGLSFNTYSHNNEFIPYLRWQF